MTTGTRTKYQRTAATCVLGTVAIGLAGCQFRPELLSASSRSVGQEEVVHVTLRSADAKTIKSRELYLSLVVVNCTGTPNRFPAETRIKGQRISEFQFPTDGETVQLVASVPSDLFRKYSQPCAFLEGGGYLTGTIKSTMAPIVTENGAGA